MGLGHAPQVQEELQELESQLVPRNPRPSGEDTPLAQSPAAWVRVPVLLCSWWASGRGLSPRGPIFFACGLGLLKVAAADSCWEG